MKDIKRFLTGAVIQVAVLGGFYVIHQLFGNSLLGQTLFLSSLISVQVYSTWALGKSVIK